MRGRAYSLSVMVSFEIDEGIMALAVVLVGETVASTVNSATLGLGESELESAVDICCNFRKIQMNNTRHWGRLVVTDE